MNLLLRSTEHKLALLTSSPLEVLTYLTNANLVIEIHFFLWEMKTHLLFVYLGH